MHDAKNSLKRSFTPTLPPGILKREALLQTLSKVIDSANGYKVLLVCAPGGYGKTTLLADFIRQTHTPCCWCLLEAQHIDRNSFLALLANSLSQQYPHCTPDLERLLFQFCESNHLNTGADISAENTNAIVEALVHIIRTRVEERFALILSNYHEVNASLFLKRFLNRLLERLPAQCLLIIESRSTPDLNLAPLLAHRQLYGLGGNALRFSPQEIHQLAQLQGISDITHDEAATLAAQFEGWITGILLGTRLGEVQGTPATSGACQSWNMPALRMGKEHLLAYLVHEIFGREPDIYAFLMELSILPQMLPEFCDALLETECALAHLLYLEQQGLFVTHQGEDADKRFLCHPMLRELLYEELREQRPARFQQLHRRAAHLFHGKKEYHQAILYALQSADPFFVAQLIEETYPHIFTTGFSEILVGWIDTLPEEVMAARPRLLALRAHMHLTIGEHEKALPLLIQAQSLLECPRCRELMDPDELPLLRVEILLALSKGLCLQGQYTQAQQFCQEALATLPADEITLLIQAHIYLGMCAMHLSNLSVCIAEYQQALRLSSQQLETENRQVLDIYSQLANAYQLVGNHTLSQHYLTLASQRWEQFHDEAGKVKHLITIGVVNQRHGAFAEAEDKLQQALQRARRLCFQQGEAYSLVSLADLYQDQYQYHLALTTAEQGLSLARQLKDHYLIIYALVTLAMTHLFTGDVHTATLFIEEIDRAALSDEPASYLQTLRNLAQGMILFYQQDTEKAFHCLRALETELQEAGLKREHLQTLLRLAACAQQMQNRETMQHFLTRATTLAREYDYEALLQIEFRRLPQLQQVWPALACASQSASIAQFEQQERIEVSKEPAPPEDEAGQSAQICIQAFGEPRVSLHGTPVRRWRVVHAMILCFFLLDHQRPVHKEQIFLELWPERDEPSDQALRTSVYNLRKILGESAVVSRSGFYSLDLRASFGESVWYDVAAFQHTYKQAQEALNAGDEGAAERRFVRALELYQGNYLQPFYNNWCALRRDELRRLYLDTLHQLAQISWRDEEYEASAMRWQQMLATDPCLEEAHLGLMRSYLRQGKRGLALRQYQRCVKSLEEEIGTQPGVAIQSLYKRLVNNASPEE